MALAVGFVIYLVEIGGSALPTGGSMAEYRASFRSVDGISVGSDVRVAGVKMGAVTAIALDPATFRADARFAIPTFLTLPDDSAAIIASDGIFGASYLQIVPGGSPAMLAPGDEIAQTQGAVSLLTLLSKAIAGRQ